MSRHPPDELSALERRPDPAWLWDAERNRIVWANRAGLAFWSVATVLDLIERRMDDGEEAVAAMAALAISLEPAASVVEALIFDIGGRAVPLQAECRRVLLEDGRPGLLVIGETGESVVEAPAETRANLLETVVDNLPDPVAVFDRHGSLLYRNKAAEDAFPAAPATPTEPAGELRTGVAGPGGGLFGAWLENHDHGDALLARALTRGGFSEIETLHTRFGPRAHRINARRLTASVVGQLAVLLVFDDIEDRRRYESRQAGSVAAIAAVLDAADATIELDAQGCLVNFDGAAEQVLGEGIGVLLGASWDDVLAALEITSAVPIADRVAKGEPWREFAWSSRQGASSLVFSAVPQRDDNGRFSGFGGLVIAVDANPAHDSGRLSGGPDVADNPELSRKDEEEFLADLKNDHEPVSGDSAVVEKISDDLHGSDAGKSGPALGEPGIDTGQGSDTRPGEGVGKDEDAGAGKSSGKGKVGRDDAATFSAIARALGSPLKPDDRPPAEVPAAGATLRVVGGVEAVETLAASPSPQVPADPQNSQSPQNPKVSRAEPKPEGPVEQSGILATGKPTLVHKNFAIFGANDLLARLLGFEDVDSFLEDSNLLNHLPDERARLFSLQSRFDDGTLPQSGCIEGVSLTVRTKNRSNIAVDATFDPVVFEGQKAIRIVFEAVAETTKPQRSGEDPTEVKTPADRAGISPDLITASPELPPEPQHHPVASQRPEPKPDNAALDASVAREAELRAVINSAADGIATLDEAGKIMTLNASAEALFGIKAPDVVGRAFDTLFTAKSTGTISTYLESLSSNGPAPISGEGVGAGHEVSGKRSGGDDIPLFVTIGRMNVDEGIRFCAVIRDISQWKETEDGLRLAKEQAEEESAKKSDFLARISHELRTPLNAIIGFSEVMSEEKFGPIANDRYKGYLHDIRSSGDHLLSLINDLLDLSKIESGKLDLNFTSVEVAQVIEQGVTIIQPQANKARVIVRVSLPDHLPPVVADERALRQIVLNLLSNAVKFTPPGGQVILSAVVDELGQLQIRVRDTGVGMTGDEIERAMEPFRQIENGGQNSQAGTGLGLPLTKALTEANRAEFKIESTPSAGTLVNITFPTNRVLDG